MKTNNYFKRILSLIVVLVLTMSSFSFAQGNIVKEETVYVNLDTSGKPIEKTSSIWLHSDSPLGKVEDSTTLKEVVNIKGDEEPKFEKDKLIWESNKKDLFYQGKSDKKLPVEVEVKYYLDGKEMKPQDMAGKSGNFKMKLKIKNKDSHTISQENGKNKVIYTPFVTTAIVNLPLNKFGDVKLNSGKIISDGSNQIITFATIPGFRESLDLDKNIVDMPEFLEVTATTENFEMKPIMITLTSDLPEMKDLKGAEDLDELIDGIEKIKDASQKLSDATGMLLEGQISLNSGINELLNGVGSLNTGAHSLNKGSQELKNGIDSAYEGSLKINDGANKLGKSGETLGNGLMSLSKGTVEFSQKAKEYSNGAQEVSKGISEIPEKVEMMSGGMNELIEGTNKVKCGQDKLTEGLGKSVAGLEEIKKGKEKELDVVNLLLKGVDGLETLAQGLEKVPGIGSLGEKMLEGLGKQRMALEGLKNSSGQLVEAISQVESGLKEAQEASRELSTNLEKINKGQNSVGQGMNQLAKGTEQLKGASDQLAQGSKGLAEGSNKLNENAIKAEEGSKQFSEGSKSLSKGTNELSGGLKQLSNGAEKLNNGTIELANGTEELNKGGNALKEGANKLEEGTSKLDENMKKFHEEGIMELSNRLDENDLDINEVLKTKDELINLSKDYKSFTGMNEKMEGNVKFVLKTEGIDKAEEKEQVDIKDEKKEEEKGFFNWLKNIFKRQK